MKNLVFTLFVACYVCVVAVPAQAAKTKVDARSGVVGYESRVQIFAIDGTVDQSVFELIDNNDLSECKASTNKGAPLLLVPLISGLATIIIEQRLNNISEKKKKVMEEYKKTYTGSVNFEELLTQATGDRCFLVQRSVAKSKDGSNRRVVSELLFKLEALNGSKSALILKPVTVVVGESAAKTKKGAPIDLAVSIGITTIVGQGTAEVKAKLLTTQSFAFSDVAYGTPFPGVKDFRSSIIPMPPQSTPASIAVSVTEVGSEYKNLAGQSKYFDTHMGTIAKALGGLITEALKD